MKDFLSKLLSDGNFSSKRLVMVFLSVVFGAGFIICIITNSKELATYILSMASLIGACVGANVLQGAKAEKKNENNKTEEEK